MRWIWLPLILLTAVHAQPPSPPGFTPVLSPKQKELKESWGTPMIKVSYSPGIPVPLTGFAITNLSIANNQVSLSWINGVPPFQVIGEPTLYGPWNDVGIPTTARSKTFPEDINHFFTVQGSIVMPLEATQTNNLTRLTWEAPDTDMSDSLQQFTLKRSTDNGATFPNTVAVVQPGGTYSVDDTTAIPAGGSLTWELLEQTLNGVVVPYSKPVASNVAPGTALWVKDYAGPQSDYGLAIAINPDTQNIFICGYYDNSANFGTGTLPAFGTGSGYIAKYTSAGSPVWARGFGIGAGASANCSMIFQAVAARNGFVAVAGTFSGAVDFSGGGTVGATKTAIGAHDIFVALYTDAGTFVWAKSFGTSDLSVGGTFQHQLDCSASGVVIDSAGNLLATGMFQRRVNFGDATRDAGDHGSGIFVIKLAAASGATDWSKQLGGIDTSQIQTGNGIAIDINDGTDAVFVTGLFVGASADFGDGHTLTPTGLSTVPDVFVAKYRNSDGECLWAFNYGGTDADQGSCITAIGGNVFLGGILRTAGVSVGGSPLQYAGSFIAKYLESDGSHIWSQSFSVAPGTITPPIGINGIGVDPSGNPTMVGAFSGTMSFNGGAITITGSGGANIFVVKFTAAGSAGNGVALWAKKYKSTGGAFGDGGPCHANGCAVGSDNAPVVVGDYQSTSLDGTIALPLTIDSFALTGLGNYDVILAKFSP